MRLRPILLLVGVCLLLGAAPASAAVTPGSAGTSQVYLESDEAGDNLALRCEGGFVKYEAISLLPCGVVTDIFITGEGGNDVVNLSSITAADLPLLTRVLIDGGAGTDVINGSQVGDTITSDNLDIVNSEGGDDEIEQGAQISAGAGDDLIRGPMGTADAGPGDDLIEQPSGAGSYAGGSGFDTLSFNLPAELNLDLRIDVEDTNFRIAIATPPTAITVPWGSMEAAHFSLLNGGTQTVDASRFTGNLTADGRGGPDILIGGPGEDLINGGLGNDTLTGGGNFDLVNAAGGDDQLQLRDNEIDRGVCGDGADSVVADGADSLLGCESVSLPPVSPPPVPKVPPTTKDLKGPKKVVKGKRATFKFGSSNTGGTFKCKVDKGPFKVCKSPLKVATGKLTLGKHTFSVFAIDAGGTPDPTPLTKSFSVEAPPKKH
jgi:hypothetical protein